MNFITITLKQNIKIDYIDYPKDSKLFDPVNKKVVGKMKDKLKGKVISDIGGLMPKMYCLIDVDNQENKKTKRVNKNVVENICRCFV